MDKNQAENYMDGALSTLEMAVKELKNDKAEIIDGVKNKDFALANIYLMTVLGTAKTAVGQLTEFQGRLQVAHAEKEKKK